MTEPSRTELWEALYDADWRSRYFLHTKDRLQNRIRTIGVAIALLSCGPLVGIFVATGAYDTFAAISGGLAGLLGVYLSSSGLPKAAGTASRASATWLRAHGDLKRLWNRFEGGNDVSADYLRIDTELQAIDSAVIEELTTDNKLVDRAIVETDRALGIEKQS